MTTMKTTMKGQVKNIALRYDWYEDEYGWEWEYHITFPDGRVISFRGGDWLGARLNAAAAPPEMVSASEIENTLRDYAEHFGQDWVLKYLEE